MTNQCPYCHLDQVVRMDYGKKAGGTIGTVAGAAVGVSSAIAGAEVGAGIGIIAGPIGIGIGSIVNVPDGIALTIEPLANCHRYDYLLGAANVH